MSVEWTRIDHAAAPRLAALLEGDLYSFAVMGNILKGETGEVGKIVTDGARLILAYTCPPYPGWVWTPGDAGEAELARAWALIRAELPPQKGYRVNVRPELARYVLNAAQETLHVDMQIDAYGSEGLIPPPKLSPGDYAAVGMEALEEAVTFAMASSRETGLDPLTEEACREEMRGFIERRRLFMWKCPDGQSAAMCTVTQNGTLGYLGHVYTPAAMRRRGYAASLTYRVTHAMLAQGMQPALCVVSTNEAAAACYTRLGYRFKGSICTIGQKGSSKAGAAG